MQPGGPRVPAHSDPLRSPAASSHNISLRPHRRGRPSARAHRAPLLLPESRIPCHHRTLCIPRPATPPRYPSKHYNTVRLWILYTTLGGSFGGSNSAALSENYRLRTTFSYVFRSFMTRKLDMTLWLLFAFTETFEIADISRIAQIQFSQQMHDEPTIKHEWKWLEAWK